MAELKIETPESDPSFYDNYLRLPGLFRRCEIQGSMSSGEYRLEPAGQTRDGCPLIAVYQAQSKAHPAGGEP